MQIEELCEYLLLLKSIDKTISEDNIIAYAKAIEFLQLTEDELKILLENVIQNESYITPNKVLLMSFKAIDRFKDIEKKFNIILNMALLAKTMPNRIVDSFKDIILHIGGWDRFVNVSQTKNKTEYNQMLIDFTKKYIEVFDEL